MWQDTAMKPRRPTVKDSTQHLHGEGAKRKSAQVAARAARKADAKKRKLAEPHRIPDGNLQRSLGLRLPLQEQTCALR